MRERKRKKRGSMILSDYLHKRIPWIGHGNPKD